MTITKKQLDRMNENPEVFSDLEFKLAMEILNLKELLEERHHVLSDVYPELDDKVEEAIR